jgi:hypothetical protein
MSKEGAAGVSKTRTSFYRRLYLAHLIATGTDTVVAIMAATGMPRRTAQDTLSALAELDLRCEFEQTPGARHQQGHYRISDWGPINPAWVAAHIDQIRQTLGYP